MQLNDIQATPPRIIDRGRGPEIEGTRITVYAILDWIIEGWHHERIADFLQLHPEEVQVAHDYIREHTLEVLREYVAILERSKRGNPPELQARLDANHAKFLQFVREAREAQARGEPIQPLIAAYRAARTEEAAYARNNGGQ